MGFIFPCIYMIFSGLIVRIFTVCKAHIFSLLFCDFNSLWKWCHAFGNYSTLDYHRKSTNCKLLLVTFPRKCLEKDYQCNTCSISFSLLVILYMFWCWRGKNQRLKHIIKWCECRRYHRALTHKEFSLMPRMHWLNEIRSSSGVYLGLYLKRDFPLQRQSRRGNQSRTITRVLLLSSNCYDWLSSTLLCLT